ncbi:PREDICTED: putative nuclease HARBI1 [Rhagoletis zephyria]|uniref:putative nuclease HARBI1 n=1 Tax=Rhagoletis zephyria TaxID=28612 RepID=UPI000811920A|nr:PREDICTED: putative nuclease HARBI1 [Rhagoletis zephyria]
MRALTTFAAILVENERLAEETLNRRILRDHSNPLDVSELVFVSSYRVNKSAFNMLLDVVVLHLKETSIPAQLQLAATLRFLAEGGFQKAVGKDSYIAMGRSTVAKVITRVLKILEKYICSRWINLSMTEDEKTKSKQHFHQNFGIPGVIGCVDGTHIKITKPHKDSSLFYNRKDYFSINAMIICDYNMVIRALDARRPGSSHDALIWSVSRAHDYFKRNYDNGERGLWLLGDAGYALQPFLLTPFRDPNVGTPQHIFNLKHSSARNVVERTTGVLKSRFRCLCRSLQYQPEKVVQITNVCCALHNICRHYKVQELVEAGPMDEDNEPVVEGIINEATLDGEAIMIREDIATRLFSNS